MAAMVAVLVFPWTTPGSTAARPAQLQAMGYWLVRADGATYPFGKASPYLGPASTIRGLNRPIVGVAANPDRQGLWMVAADGGVFSFGDARFYGSAANLELAAPIVGMAATPDGGGYWLLGADGGVITFGDAPYLGRAYFPCSGVISPFGSRSGCPAMVDEGAGIAATGDGAGYWIADTSAQVQHFGDAGDLGTYSGPVPINGPTIGITPTPAPSSSSSPEQGYYLVGADGGVFAFGDARFYGSASGVHLAASIVGLVVTQDAGGYWLVGADGGVFTYGDAEFLGSAAGQSRSDPMAGLASAG